jgi:hypothetical protein
MSKFFDLASKLIARLSDDKSAPRRPRAPDLSARTPAKTSLRAAAAEALRQAQQDAVSAEQDVDRVSQAHLARLMVSPLRNRMAHLNDPELTSADRGALANSVRSALPASFRLRFPGWRPTGALRGLKLRCGYKCIRPLAALVTCAVATTFAWRNTGTRLIGSDDTWIVDWRLPDGAILHGAWNARIPTVAMRAKNGTVVLRLWLNGRGYATTEVDEHWLLDHSFTYVVAPTGATAVASPANR